MTYVPREYWEERATAQGPSFVGPGGHEKEARVQADLFRRTIEGALAGRSFNVILDFGCGSGRLTDTIAMFGFLCWAMDISKVALEQARTITVARNIEFYHLAEDQIPLLSDSVDLVVAVTVFQHIVADDAWELWTDELRRVLRPTGSVLIIDEAHHEDAIWDDHVRSRPPYELARALDRGIVTLPSLTDHWAGMLVP